jgi:tetratricopeptide (TPR) repeat protein
LYTIIENVQRQLQVNSQPARRNENDNVSKITDNQTDSNNYIVSAIVSSYNAERFMHGCLEDLENQTIADRLEIIVVDSGSRQNEEKIVRQFQKNWDNIKYIRTENRETVYSAWNIAIQAASGKYITNANTDDRHRRDAFEVMANFLENRPDIALVYADLIITETENETFENCTPIRLFKWLDWNRQELLEKGCFMGPQPMWRKSMHDLYGYFDASFVTSGDYEFWLRISQTESFLHLPELLGLYLKSPHSIEHTNRKQQVEENRKILSMYRNAQEKREIIRKLDNVSRDRGISMRENQTLMNFKQITDATQTLAVKKNKQNCRQGGNDVKSFEQMYQEILPMIENQWYEAAINALEKLLETHPQKPIVRSDLGALYYKVGQPEKALSHYRRAAELQPENVEVLKSLADFYYAELGQTKAALEIYENILILTPDDVPALLLTGHIHVSLNRFDSAAQKYRRALEIEPWNADARQFLEALEAQGAGRAGGKTAEDMYREIEPQINSGQADAAIDALKKLLSSHPDFALAHNDLGVFYYNQGDKITAQLHYERAARLEPENITFQKNLADFYFVELNRVEEAMAMYVKILEANPQDVETLLTAGHISVALQRFDDARDIYNRVLEIEPWNADARQFLEALDTQGAGPANAKTAEDMYQEIEPLVNSNQPDAAIEVLEKLLASYPDFALACNDLGVLYYNQGDKVKAQSYYEDAARLQPDNITFQKNLADFYFVERNRIQDAMDIYVKILEGNPEDVETLLTAGHISVALQRFDDARTIYNRILEIEPWNADARQSLENVDNQQINGNPGEAITNVNEYPN